MNEKYVGGSDAAPGALQAISEGRSAEPTSQVAGSVQAVGTLTLVTDFVADQTVTVNGTVFTAKASGATGAQFNIGVSKTATLVALAVVLNASVVAGVAKATYTSALSVLTVTHDAGGVVGNAFTLATNVSDAVVVAPVGGVDKAVPEKEFAYFDVSQALDQDFYLGTALDGTKKSVMLRTKASTGGVVVHGVFDGGTSITFDTVGEYAALQFMVGKWRVIKNTGVLA